MVSFTLSGDPESLALRYSLVRRREPLIAMGSNGRNGVFSRPCRSVFSPPGKFSHPEIVQLVSELEAERNANILTAAAEPGS